jgi:hypothetical protein
MGFIEVGQKALAYHEPRPEADRGLEWWFGGVAARN